MFGVLDTSKGKPVEELIKVVGPVLGPCTLVVEDCQTPCRCMQVDDVVVLLQFFDSALFQLQTSCTLASAGGVVLCAVASVLAPLSLVAGVGISGGGGVAGLGVSGCWRVSCLNAAPASGSLTLAAVDSPPPDPLMRALASTAAPLL